MERFIEKLLDMLPLLIFILFPLLGKLLSFLTKQAEKNAKPPQPQPRRPVVPSPPSKAPASAREVKPTSELEAFFQGLAGPQPDVVDEDLPEEFFEDPTPVPVVPIAKVPHRRDVESLKEHLSHRGKLSMNEPVEEPLAVPALEPITGISGERARGSGLASPSESAASKAAWSHSGAGSAQRSGGVESKQLASGDALA